MHARAPAILPGGSDVALRKFGITFEDDLAFQTSIRIWAPEAEISPVIRSHTEEPIYVITQAKIQGEVLGDAEIILYICPPVTEAFIRSPHHARGRVTSVA